MLIAIDTVALFFPVASLNGVSIRVTRSLHSHVASSECYVRFAFIRSAGYRKQRGVYRLSHVPRFSDAFMHMYTPATPVSVILVRFSLRTGTCFTARSTLQFLHLFVLLRQWDGAKNVLKRLQDNARYYCHCIFKLSVVCIYRIERQPQSHIGWCTAASKPFVTLCCEIWTARTSTHDL